MARKGAVQRDRDVNADPSLEGLDAEAKRLRVIEEGKRVLRAVVSPEYVSELAGELKKIHAARFILGDIKYRNVIVEKHTHKPYFIDFDNSLIPEPDERRFQDTARPGHEGIQPTFQHTGTDVQGNKGTVQGQRGLFARLLRRRAANGQHLERKRRIRTLALHPEEQSAPFSGKRVLDLGVNNAYVSIQLARGGAAEVIGVELDSKAIAQGEFVKAGSEWLDNKRHDFRYIQANMADVATMDLGEFDMVLALCSLLLSR